MTKPEIMRTNLLILESLLVLLLLTRQLPKSRKQILGWTTLITYLINADLYGYMYDMYIIRIRKCLVTVSIE